MSVRPPTIPLRFSEYMAVATGRVVLAVECLAHAEAALKKWQAAMGDAGAYQCATMYAQWGNTAKALEWLAPGHAAP